MAQETSPEATQPLEEAIAAEVRAQRFDSMSGPDSPEGRELGRAIGANVARHRREHGLDLATVATRSEIRVDLLEKLEGGQAVPSLRAVWQLATALEVPFGALLENTILTEAADPDFRVQAAGHGRVIVDADNKFRSRVLFPEGDPHTPEVYELTLDPGCFEPAEAHALNTFEHIVVISGKLILRAGEKQATLGAGDSIYFRADVKHSYENTGDVAAVAHLVMQYASRSH